MGRRGRGTSPYPTVQAKTTKQILTNEDWHPTIDGKVDASLISYSDGMWRVCVWGGDDTGVEYDVYDETDARRQFDRIVHLTTRAELYARGFKPA